MANASPEAEASDDRSSKDAASKSEGPSFLFVGGALRVDGREEADAGRRLTETVGRLLQVKNLAVLLGAGASFHLGAPSIRKLSLSDLGEFLRAGGRSLEQTSNELLTQVVGSARVDLEQLLALMSTSIAYARATRATRLRIGDKEIALGDFVALRLALNRALASQCQLPRDGAVLNEPFRTDPWWAHKQFFRRLLRARRLDLPRVRIFTTNYDLAVEQTLDEIGTVYFDGFTGNVRRSFHPETFDQDVFVPSAAERGRVSRLTDVLYLYKLHGSINWRSATSSTGFGTDVVVSLSSSEALPDDLALIYPTPQKEVDVLGFPYSELFRAFAVALSEPETALMVLGSGLRDDHINRIILQAVLSGPTFHLFVADPFGVLAQSPTSSYASGEAITFSDSPSGQLAQAQDARVSVLTGPVARFVDFATRVMPDPEEPTIAEAQADALSMLAKALTSAVGPEPVQRNDQGE